MQNDTEIQHYERKRSEEIRHIGYVVSEMPMKARQAAECLRHLCIAAWRVMKYSVLLKIPHEPNSRLWALAQKFAE